MSTTLRTIEASIEDKRNKFRQQFIYLTPFVRTIKESYLTFDRRVLFKSKKASLNY